MKIEKKIRNPLIVYLILFSIILIVGIPLNERGFMRFFPDHMGFQIIYIFNMITIASIIGTLFTGYILAPLFLVTYKYTVGIRMTFGIQDSPKSSKLKILFKGIFPALLGVQIAMLFTDNNVLLNMVIDPNYLIQTPQNASIVFLAVLIPLMTGIGMGIFSPVWFLLDAGIVFTNKNKVINMRDPIEVRSVGGWYHYMMKGYAGVSVIFSYFVFISNFIIENQNPSVLLLIFLPLLILVFSIPSFILLEITANHRIKYMRRIAKRVGISEPLRDPLNISEE